MQKKKWVIGIVICCAMFFAFGISYALWQKNEFQKEMNQITSGCFSLTFQNESKGIMLDQEFPLLTTDGLNLTPYTFTITNTCSVFASFDITLNTLLTSTLDSKYVAVVLDRNAVKTFEQYDLLDTLEGYQESRLLQSSSLSPNDSETFHLRIWMDENVGPKDAEAMDKIFQAKIAVIARPSTYSPVALGFDTLAEAMLVNEYQSANMEHAKEKIETKQAPDFSKTAPIIDWKEKQEENITLLTITMPHPEKVGEYDGFDNIEKSYLRVSNHYNFNAETGKYDLIDPFLVDPTAITDYDTKNYYFCYAGTSISVDDRVDSYQVTTNCSELYRISSTSKEEAFETGPSGKVFQMIRYNLSSYKYYQQEVVSDKSDKGLYLTLDDNGESYYYRGSVSNNYVKFAGFYWRIIRLNGDGSVRLLYAGETPDASGLYLSIQNQASHFNWNKDLPGYVGYMYGNNLDTYENASKNEQDSTIKTILDQWYQQNIFEKGYHDKIADSIFCNDREIYSGDGYSTNLPTYYQTHNRMITEKNPTYFCSQRNDRFTVSEEKGNGALTYPIGLITSDELMYAGMVEGYLNKLSYVFSSFRYWTMSPGLFNNGASAAMGIDFHESGQFGFDYVVFGYGVRAVINIRPEVKITSGIGTANDPFVIP
ncbi:MAG: hypothetical protein HFH86_03845 [Bacilli bacterium]|nr:hypothetical protein [Bacilli bacterium]